MISFLKKYILPKEVDFIAGIRIQSDAIKKVINDMYFCFTHSKEDMCKAIIEDEHKTKEIRDKNINELLNAFITPVDRESIYRVITQLDWIALSSRHFILEAGAYEVKTTGDGCAELLEEVNISAQLLNNGFINLKENLKMVPTDAQNVRESYEKIVKIYIQKMAELSKSNNLKEIFIKRELYAQLKEIGKRLQVCANSLEDMGVKML